MKYFILTTIFICSIHPLFAQDFFIPDGAIKEVTDNLPPLPQALQERAASYGQRRHSLSDGRVFALEDEMDAQKVQSDFDESFEAQFDEAVLEALQENLAQDTLFGNENEPEEKLAKIVVSPESTATSEQQAPVFAAPLTVEKFDDTLPDYKKRYALYLEDLKTFQQTKSLPQNQELNKTLDKLSTIRTEVLFEGTVD
ncbi:MAG: hypothetical protein J5895_04225 [Alphaproteobacteria bacterium]|nr:hypothetical protein [Alphaproteobacteria bacterium]